MNPTVRKAFLFMVGAAAVTKEKVNQFIAELEKEGALNEDEGKELFREMMQKGEERASQIRDMVREEVKKYMENGEKSSDSHESHGYEHKMHQCCCGQECHAEGHQCGEGECDCDCENCDHEGCECRVVSEAAKTE